VVGSTYSIDECFNILDAEAERNDHGDAKNTIQRDTPHHGLRQLDRGILQLLTHVRTSIRTDEAPDGRCQTNKSAETVRAPATAIVKFGEDLVSRCVIGHDPEDDQEGEEAKDVSEENDSFGQWQVVGAPDVERNDQEGECEHEQCDLPLGRECRVRVSGGNELLDDAGQLCGA